MIAVLGAGAMGTALATHLARIGHPVGVLATKGWEPETLLTPSQVAAKVLGDAAPVVTLAGPGIAAEIVVGSPTALLFASRDPEARRLVARTLSAPSMLTLTTSDVAGAE